MIDLDGTLVNSSPEIARAINAMLVLLNLPRLPAAQVESYIGDGAEQLIKRSITQDGVSEPSAALFKQAKQLFFDEYAKVVVQSQPYPGVVSALQSMKKAGYRLACVTNKPQSFTQALLIASNLLPYFELVVTGDTLAKKNLIRISLFIVASNLEWHSVRRCWWATQKWILWQREVQDVI